MLQIAFAGKAIHGHISLAGNRTVIHVPGPLYNKIRARFRRSKCEHHIGLVFAHVVQADNTLGMKTEVGVSPRILQIGNNKESIKSVRYADADGCFSVTSSSCNPAVIA